jgi:cell division transport system permease protein
MSSLDNQEPDSRSYPRLNREMSLVPADSIGGRALVVVIAIMTFLVCFTAGSATLVTEASRSWRDSVSNDVTIQIKPRLGEDTDAIVSKAVEAAKLAPGVAAAHALSRNESEQTLEPWLGRGLDLSQLPIPRLIVVTMRSSQPADLQSLREALALTAPRASLDDHQLWISRLNAFGEIIVALAVGLLSLMIIAMSTAIGFATRGAMAGNSEVIAVLHFVGAADTFIARQFQTHFTRLGSRGAAIGGSVAALFFVLTALYSYGSTHSLGANGIGALFGEFTLSAMGYVFIAAICVAIAALTGLISRAIVFNYLQRLF